MTNINKISKKLVESIEFNYNEFNDLHYFINRISTILKVNEQYGILVRTCYYKSDNEDDELKESYTEFKMIGNQIYVSGKSHDELIESIIGLYNSTIKRLNNSMDNYDYDEGSILIIQCIIYNLTDKPTINKKPSININSLGSNKDIINVKKTKEYFNNLPLTYDKDNFGEKLDKSINNNKIDKITLLNGNIINIEQLIELHNKYGINLKADFDFYEKQDNIIIVNSIDTSNQKVYIVDKSGTLITWVEDILLGPNHFSRKIGKNKFYIDNRGVYKKEIDIEFKPVSAKKITGKLASMTHPDWRFGAFDLETYNQGDISKTYAAGFYTKDDTNKFYIDKDLDSDKLIVKMLDRMITEKYTGYTFYAHNFSGYDVYFILRVILCSNLIEEKYKYKIVWRDNVILGLNISRKINNKTYSIRMADSYNHLKAKLSDLCVTFQTEYRKSPFPYLFVNKNNLFYIGNKPDIKYYNNITNIEYENIKLNNWSLEKETLLYLDNDLYSLYEVMEKYISQVYIDYGNHVSKSLTISSLAMDIFLRKFYDDNIPLIKNKSIYRNIKKSYYGGITEVYIPYGKDLYYYDVNSLYPFVALNDMPGLNCVFTDNINRNIKDMKDIFGFFYCKIKTPKDLYIGLLPTKSKEGLVMGLGEWKDWYFSAELIFAYENGYEIEVISGYQFDRAKSVFKKYVDTLYYIKMTTKNKIIRQIVKSLLNNLLGRFGLDIDKYITAILSEDKFTEVLKTRDVIATKYISSDNKIEDKILVNYSREINKQFCEENNLDYKEVFMKNLNANSPNKDNYHDVSIVISAAITSYARVYINKIKLDILNKGGKIYYSDTDSIVTDIKLPNNLVGTDLGLLKLEHEIKEGYFISNKTYSFISKEIKDDKNVIVTKCKGLDSKSLKHDDFKQLYLGNKVKAIKVMSKKDFSKGSVKIKIPKPVWLSPFSYTKRVKIYKNNLWIDTKPIDLNTKYHTINYFKNKYFFINKNMVYSFVISVILLSIILLYSYYYNNENVVLEVVNSYIPETEIYFKDNDYIDKTSKKGVFNKFIDLFINKSNNHIPSYCKHYNPIHNTDINNIDIKHNNLYHIYNNEINRTHSEIQQLQEHVSLLKIEILNMKIDKLDQINEIKAIIKDLETNSILH